MAESAIPDEVKAFIAAHIDSVLQLEILLLLQAHPQRQWSAADVAQELRIDALWASNQMAELAAAGILSASQTSPPVYHYDPRTPQLDRAAKGLAQEYTERRVTVIGLIFSKPLDKMRSFADAFRIRKDKPDA